MAEDIRIDDLVQMKKKHPCGSDEWTVTRTGADIKIRCSGCGRVVMLDRETFLKRRKKLLRQGETPVALPYQPIPAATAEDLARDEASFGREGSEA